jgi:uncharacterized coiled-coil protein SlyX
LCQESWITENVENLLLDYAQWIQASLDRIERGISEITSRTANLESAMASVMQHVGNLAAANAAQQLAIDNVSRRLDRIENRLELTH